MTAIVKPGITEDYWGLMNEDRKLGWELLTKSLAIVAGWCAVKTGITVIDSVIAVFAAFTPLFVIRSQRSFRKHSKNVRKHLLGTIIFLGGKGAALLGSLYFGIALLSSVAQTYATEVAPFRHHANPLVANIMLGVLLFAIPVAGVRAWRGLGMSELVFDLPKRSLKRLVLQRKYVADSFVTFAHFELSVQVVGFAYASVCAQIINTYLSVFVPK
ncbi:hypothetical protein SAMN04487926_1125 [Paraburkholderia steynii]|uniref:Uncharacterized protein n=1 Tax=Paraburkholderia steynii TaxID=1245441 RepID=A0A7Z7FJY1_9BURK|nr:hypothetical protein [Paraburkholderia steynii]SDI09853.1 hypothetical protein SAMN04487926_1125 [Paraburkholderia steynii]